PIARGQLISENKAAAVANKVLFCDTNLLQLEVYSRYYHNGHCPPQIAAAVAAHHYHHYFLTCTDVPWVADNLRDRPNDREGMFALFETALVKRNLSRTILKGNQAQRLQRAISVVNTFI
ncbi:MAG: AAA family ATPase, partial [Marinirhabdus sp.]